MIKPINWAKRSINNPASLRKKIKMAITPLMIAPVSGAIPNIEFKPRPAPPTLPMLNASPPITISAARKYPAPGKTALEISCARFPDTTTIRQILS